MGTIFWFDASVLAVSQINTVDIFNAGVNNLRQHNYRQALNNFTQVITRQDNFIDAAYSNRCLVNLQLQDYAAAEADCTMAIAGNPKNVEAHLNLGLSYYHQDRYERAIAQYRQVVRQNTNDYRAYYNLGLAYFALKNYQQARENYNLALISPRSIPTPQKTLIYNDRALTYMMLSDYKRAIADTERAIDLEHRNYTAYFNRGCAHHRRGNYLAAIEDFTKVLQLKPEFTQAYVNRGILQHRMGNDRAAFIDLDAALRQYKEREELSAYERVSNLKQQLIYSQPSQIG
ncbi:tetratricopeptide repeat protein [Myxosarcina sp. GI1(2024)]